jgi:hypothetical protein
MVPLGKGKILRHNRSAGLIWNSYLEPSIVIERNGRLGIAGYRIGKVRITLEGEQIVVSYAGTTKPPNWR